MSFKFVFLCAICFCAVINVFGHSIGYRPNNGKFHDDDDDNWVWVPPSSKNPNQNALFYIVYPSTDFSYTNDGGSRNWPSTFRECGGTHQSPINIQTRQAHSTAPMPMLEFKHYWDNENPAVMNNSGKRVDIMLEGKFRMPTLHGGPLEDKYEFVELHFHWGQNDREGSEHTINSQTYPMEAHLVHFKKEYGNVKDATKHLDGIAVVAFFFQVVTNERREFSELVADLRRIRKANSSIIMSAAGAGFRWIKSLINGSYFTYPGSLTTPPCSEVVIWIVYERPTKISRQQLDEFRKLESPDGHKITNNHRAPQRYVRPNVVVGTSQSEETATPPPIRFPSGRSLQSAYHSGPSQFHYPNFHQHEHWHPWH